MESSLAGILLLGAALAGYWLVQWRTGWLSTRYYAQVGGLLLITLLSAGLAAGLWPSALALAAGVVGLYHGGLFGFKLLLDTDNKYRWIHKPSRALVRYDYPHERLMLTTADGVRLQALRLRNEAAQKAVIVCHGAGRSKNTLAIVQTCTILARQYAVFTFDFRGHMESGGVYRADNATEHDLNAMIDYVRAAGYEQIAVVGWSVGATTALLAAANGSPIAAIVAGAPPPVSLREYKMLRFLRRYPFIRIPGAGAAAVSRYMRYAPGESFMDVLEFAGRVPALPVLVAYNEYDVTLGVSAAAFEGLIARLPPTVEALPLPGEGHLFDWPNTFFFWQKLVAWLDEHF